jgi:multisubunit Na+/H+ antiporter MnhB subunit
MRRSLIHDVVVRAEFHAVLVVSLYLLFVGHNSPGGGFAGGLVAGSALALRFVSLGPASVRRTTRVAPTTLLGVGLLFALGTTMIPLLTGHDLLDHGALDLHAPLLGDAHVTSALTFDCGVYLVVVGLVAFLLEAFGGRGDEPVEVPPGDDRTIGEARR